MRIQTRLFFGVLILALCAVGAPASAMSLRTAARASASRTGSRSGRESDGATDAVSATVDARATGQRVEDLSQRTETTQVYANPDGTWTSEETPGPVRVKDSAGEWQDVDTTLVERDGTVVPTYAASDLKLSDGGDNVFAQLTEDGKQVEFKWPTTLPKPTIDGASATYAGAVDGGDLVVTATPTGFEHSIILRERPASLDDLTQTTQDSSSPSTDDTAAPNAPPATGTASATTPAPTGASSADPSSAPSDTPSSSPSGSSSDISAPSDPFQVATPIATDGAKLSEAPAGGIEVVTKSGDLVAAAAQPMMWDSRTDSNGDPTNVAPVDVTVTAPGQSTPEGATAGVNPVLTLTPDQNFLAAPDTQYPVTIDPSFTTNANGDTWIENAGLTSSQDGDATLHVGTSDSGAHYARSYLQFSNTALAGKHITKATLWMRNFYSTNCTAANINATRIIDPWTVSTLTWANRPNFTNTDMGIFSTAYGASGCAANGANWDVTNIVDGWANGTFANDGLQVRGNTETYNGTFREYRSLNYNVPAEAPRLVVTYNQAPNLPVQPTASAVGTYAPTANAPVQTYVQTTTPTLKTTVTDPDKGSLQAYFQIATTAGGPAVATCMSGAVASGASVSCTSATALADGGTYYARSTGWDGYDYSGGTRTITSATKWSATFKFTVAVQTPLAPSVSCPSPYSNGTWAAVDPTAPVVCTISAPGTGSAAAGFITVSVDGSAPDQRRIQQSNDPNVAQTTVTLTPEDGPHTIVATAQSPSSVSSPATTYRVGWGTMGLASPSAGAAQPTTDTVPIDAGGPPSNGGSGTPTATLKWRIAGTNGDYNTGWNTDTSTTLTVTNDATGGVRVTGTWDTTKATVDSASGPSPITLDPNQPYLLDVEVCVAYPHTLVAGDCTWSTTRVRQVLRVAHAFGGNYPTASVPGGQVALWTGELETDATDATVTAPTTGLSISRTAASFAGPVANPDTAVFGPGWSASLDGPDSGEGAMTLIDNTLVDGTLQLVDGVGDVMSFGSTASPSRRTLANLDLGTWVPLDEDTKLSGTRLKVTGAGALTVVSVTDADGTVTTYAIQSVATMTAAAVFTVTGINEPGAVGATTYSTDTAGRVTRMLAPVPVGVDCSDPNGLGLPAGCRAMTITYTPTGGTTATSSTPGDVEGQVKEIDQVIGGGTATAPTPSTTKLATYLYDGSHRLVQVTDPRITANPLTTKYTYDSTSKRIATITPPGLKTIHYLYATGTNQLGQVTRDDLTGSSATTLNTIVYGIGTSGTGRPTLDQAAVSAWGQPAAPTHGAAAVFGQDHQIPWKAAGVAPSDISTSDWLDANLSYTDDDGQAVNTASYGAGAWQFTDTEYDSHQNEIRSLSSGDIAAVKAGTLLASQAGTLTTYNGEADVAGSVVWPEGSAVTDTYATARWIRDASGNLVWARPHTHTDYDEGAPNSGINPATGQRYSLATTVTSDAVDPATGNVLDTYSLTSSDYSTAVNGDTNAGWNMGLVGTNTTKMAGSAGPTTTDIVSQTRYDSAGRIIETDQPNSSGSDDGSRRTYYYTAGTHPTVAACGTKPAWAGQLCQTAYAGSSPTLVTTTTAGYDDQLNPLSTVENAGAVTRTTTKTYNADGRLHTTTIATSGLTGSTAIGATTYTYDPGTGLPTLTTTSAAGGNAGGTITTGYDAWGRQTTYAPATGETTTTNYDTNGRVGSVVDPQGTTTYTYNGTDAAGNSEHRGLTTGINVTTTGSSSVNITGAYDASGHLVLQKLPGGITQRTGYDTGGEPISLSYSGQVDIVDPTSGAVTGEDPDAPWVAWSQDNDALGRVRREWTPIGGALTGDLTGAAATGFSRDYTYDRAGRLVEAKDQTVPVANAGAGTTNPDDQFGLQAITACQYRDYTFDADGNRTSLTTTTGAAGAACPTPGGTGAVTKTWGYDTGIADRITTAPGGGANTYAYDAFGRVSTLPQADTPAAAAGGTPGSATLAYYDTDAIKSITQNGITTGFGLDPIGRRSTSTTTPATGAATVITRHYTDSSDNPGWTSTVTGAGSPVIDRITESLDGNLGLTITGTAVALSVVDLHGDAVSQIATPTTGAATGLDSWSDTDEYGNPLSAASVGKTPSNLNGVAGGIGYGWLGGTQRATDASGLLLMGARLYDPLTGGFSSTDPMLGGNVTTYTYPGDPVNGSDPTGLSACVCGDSGLGGPGGGGEAGGEGGEGDGNGGGGHGEPEEESAPRGSHDMHDEMYEGVNLTIQKGHGGREGHDFGPVSRLRVFKAVKRAAESFVDLSLATGLNQAGRGIRPKITVGGIHVQWNGHWVGPEHFNVGTYFRVK